MKLQPGFTSWPARLTLLALLTSIAAAPALSQTQDVNDLAKRFRIAPGTVTVDKARLLQVSVNGVDFGNQLVGVSGATLTLPAPLLKTLGISHLGGDDLELTPTTGFKHHFDEQTALLTLEVPADQLVAEQSAPDVPVAVLTPETWGAYVNYDLNLHHTFNPPQILIATAASSAMGMPKVDYGGNVDVRGLAPDGVVGLGWAYDNTQASPLTRLDSTATWRPVWLGISVSLGDLFATPDGSLAQARSYRFGGVQVGTDHSGTPGWSSSLVRASSGTSQVETALDVFLDSERQRSPSSQSGPSSVLLQGAGGASNLLSTDVAGRTSIVPLEVPQIDARLLRQGMFLWSAGAGAPRFGYGSAQTSYDHRLYAYGSAQYGALSFATPALHVEGGPGLLEIETGVDARITSWLILHGTTSVSRSQRGLGQAVEVSLIVSKFKSLLLETSLARTFGPFDDVVSVTGRAFSRGRQGTTVTTLPPQSQISARLSWQATDRLSMSASYRANTQAGEPAAGFASLTANYLFGGRIPLFANLSHQMGTQSQTALLAGLSYVFGDIQSSASGGYATGTNDRSRLGGAASGTVTASQPLAETQGSMGWDVYATHAPSSTFTTADGQLRTGYGVPGVALQSFNNQVTGYTTLRGAAGVVGLHPFLSDPASGGLIIADAGQPGVPVELNGYEKGKTSFDGKIALPAAVSGVPQRVGIDTSKLPIDEVPSDTEKLVVVRDRGAALASFGVQVQSHSATILVVYRGGPPPVGSLLKSATSSAPISKEGRAFLPDLAVDEVVRAELPFGGTCHFATHFDGHGGVARRIGPFSCEDDVH